MKHLVVIVGSLLLATQISARPGHGGPYHGGFHGNHNTNVNTNVNANTNVNTNSNANNNTNTQSITMPNAVVSGGGPVVSTVRRPMPSDGFVSPSLPDQPPEIINPYEDWIAGSPLPPYEVKCGDGKILRAPRGSAMVIFKCPNGDKITLFN